MKQVHLRDPATGVNRIVPAIFQTAAVLVVAYVAVILIRLLLGG
jgi:hypothetical protein